MTWHERIACVCLWLALMWMVILLYGCTSLSYDGEELTYRYLLQNKNVEATLTSGTLTVKIMSQSDPAVDMAGAIAEGVAKGLAK